MNIQVNRAGDMWRASTKFSGRIIETVAYTDAFEAVAALVEMFEMHYLGRQSNVR